MTPVPHLGPNFRPRQDRCHRIGQSRPVVVYRLLTAGTVEIEMMEKQISKKKLERLTIHGYASLYVPLFGCVVVCAVAVPIIQLINIKY